MSTYLLNIILIIFFVLLDYLPSIIIAVKKLAAINLTNSRNYDYTIVVTVFKKCSYLENLELLRRYGKHVVILTTNRETKEFNHILNEYCKKYGYRTIRLRYGKDFEHPLSAMPLFVRGIRHIKTNYVVRMDADTIAPRSFSYLFGALHKNKLDLASVKVLPLLEQKNGNILEQIQYREYDRAMESRVLFPYLTSGAAIVGKTKAIKKILKWHTGMDNGEDLEIGKIGMILGYKIGYIDFTVHTEVPKSIKRWIKQRIYWNLGAFRHAIINISSNPLWLILYDSIIVFGLLPFRIFFLLKFFYLIPLLQVYYIFLNLISNWKNFSALDLFTPTYSLINTSILPVISIFKYFLATIKTKNWGIIVSKSKLTRVHLLNK